MARISLTPPRTLINRMAAWYSRRTYGAELQPLALMAHNRKVMLTEARFETSVAKWNALDPTLKILAEMSSAHRIGCSWCTDFGYWHAHSAGLDRAVIEAVPLWRESDLFSPVQRRVLEYAELMSGEVHEVTDGLVEALRNDLGEAALVELTMMVAVENQRSRFNSALGLTSQGFRDRCEVPVG